MAPENASETPVPVGDDHALIDGRYRLEARLGSGGMGVVYRASHVGLRRQVAIKILHPGLAASPEVRSRFEREALAIGKIDHPNCVGVYDVGRLADGSLYLVMELLVGRSLASVIAREGELPPVRALRILAHLLRGLGHVHAAGLIHRDVKPDNILLVKEGDDGDFAKLLDFGIAKPMAASDLDDGVRLTQAGMAFGTPVYMAPEQALGEPIDGRADLYAASVVAYEMLTGRPPFWSDDKLQVMAMHTAGEVAPMASRRFDDGEPVPAEVEALIRRGLAKRAGDRPQSAAEYVLEIEALLVAFEDGRLGAASSRGGGRPTGDAGAADEDEATAGAPRATTAVEPARADARTDQSPTAAPGAEATARTTAAPAAAVAEAVPELRSRWPLYLFIGAAAIVLGAVFALASLPRGGARPGVTDPASPLGAAATALSHGDAQAAIDLLEANRDRFARDPDAQLLLGHAHAARREAAPALEAYRAALALDPARGGDATLRANLKSMATDPGPRGVAEALELWCTATADPECRPALRAAAASEALDRRRAARGVIERHRLGEGVDWLAAYRLDLEQEPTCERRREAVSQLRALGDPRAIPALEAAIARTTRPGPDARPASPCLLDDARAAIAYLRDRAAPAGRALPSAGPR